MKKSPAFNFKLSKGVLIMAAVLLVLAVPLFARAASWWPIVPCGLQQQPAVNGVPIAKTVHDYTQPCNQCDVILLFKNMIDFFEFWVVPIVGTFFFILAGFLILLGGGRGNPGQVQQGQSIMKNTVIGIAIVLASWLIANTFLKTLAAPTAVPHGKCLNSVCSNSPSTSCTQDSDCPIPWYQIQCTSGSLLGSGATVPHPGLSSAVTCVNNACSDGSGPCLVTADCQKDQSSRCVNNQCVNGAGPCQGDADCGKISGGGTTGSSGGGGSSGSGSNTGTTSGGSGNGTGTTGTTGNALSCIYHGVDYATANLCSGLARPGGCGTSQCSNYLSSIQKYANGAATVDVLKTFMVVESDCNINADSGSSFGLMQISVTSAATQAYKCGLTASDITKSWLKDPANADKSICIAAAYINSVSAGSCGSDPAHLYAGYNGNAVLACAKSSDCGNDSCFGGPTEAWECPYDDPAHTQCNEGPNSFMQTKQGARYVQYCINNLGF